MVDHFVVLVNLKNEGIVNIVNSEYLNASPSGKKNEHNNESYYVNIQTWLQVVPAIIIALNWRKDSEINQTDQCDKAGS